MTNELVFLCITAASIGFFHTLFGPDHYLPFIVMARAGNWSLPKTTLVTFLCGLGHVGSSVLLGFVGVILGISVSKLELIEGSRGSLAAWALIAFGLIYAVWGLRRAIRNHPHSHLHLHQDGTSHVHHHSHQKEHVHVHEESQNLTPWILFTIFVFGPCEPLIPLLMYPAAKIDFTGVILVTAIFSLTTISTMLAVVLIASYGISLFPTRALERYSHAIAGLMIFCCGMAIEFLGL